MFQMIKKEKDSGGWCLTFIETVICYLKIFINIHIFLPN